MAAVTAEGKPDPYWAPPGDMAERMQAVFAGVRQYAANPSRIVALFAKSANKNAVVVEYDAERGALQPYWVALEPAEQERLRAEGNTRLITKLSALEEMLYGVEVQRRESDGAMLARMRLPQLAHRTMELLLEADGSPVLVGDIGGVKARMQYAYVQMARGLLPASPLSIKSLEAIIVCGTAIADNAVVQERIPVSVLPDAATGAPR